MTAEEQRDAFSNDLHKLIERTREEFDVTFTELIYILNLTAAELCQEADNLDELESGETDEEGEDDE